MRRTLLSLVLVVFLPALVCQADSHLLDDPSDLANHHNALKRIDLRKDSVRESSELSYGFLTLSISRGTAQEVKLDHGVHTSDVNPFALENTAEASMLPSGMTIPNLEMVCNAINNANELQQLKTVLTPAFYQQLENRVKEGSYPYMVLAMLQAMRPNDIHVLDFSVREGQISLVVKGRSYFGPVGGLIHLVNQDGFWRIGKEDWYAGGGQNKDYISYAINPLPIHGKYVPQKPAGFMAQFSPESRINPNRLALQRVPYSRNKKSLNFVFFATKKSVRTNPSGDIYDKNLPMGKRPPMHVLWTGSNRLMPEQKVVGGNSPIDFSIANDDDGYSPGQWNFVMPTKKPREITVSILLNF